MKTTTANLINGATLIILSLWAYLSYVPTIEKPEPSVTTLIPLFLGLILLLCNKSLSKENKVISHIAVIVTLITIIALTMPLRSAISDGRDMATIRVSLMLLSGLIAMITFIKSFINARKK
tara:strand:- start:7292 stop:7654 length:363 start_codon:yes stop_codon:yes gene_type:complete